MTSRRSGPLEIDRRDLLASVGALALLAGCSAVPAEGEVPMTTRPSGDFVTVGQTRLHYKVMGDGPPVAVIHGASGNLRDWTLGPAAELARTNRLFLFDRPGLGFSNRAATEGDSPFQQARLMRSALQALGVERSHLIGHSYGGSVALAWALDMPQSVTGLIALGAPSQVWPGGVNTLYHLTGGPLAPVTNRILPLFVGEARVRAAVEAIFTPQEPPEGYSAGIGADLTLRPATLRANGEDILALKDHIRTMVPRYPSLTMPVELIHGTSDEIVPNYIHSDKTVEQIPGARHTPLLGIGHMPHHAAPEALIAALKRLNAQL